MAGQPFAGVDLDAKLSETTSAPEVSDGGGATDKAPEVSNHEGTPEKPEQEKLDKPSIEVKPEIPDLDKLERFRWKGKDLTRDELEKAYLRHEDYTRKVSQVSEQRKYAENFEYDLAKVVENPALLGEMRKVYPSQFVKIAESVLNRLPSKRDDVASAPNEFPNQNFESEKITSLEAQLQRALQQVEELTGWRSGIDEQVKQANLAKAEAQIDKWFDDLGKKYPEADPEIVNAKAIYLSEQLKDSGKPFTQAELEKLFKAEHERLESRYAERYRTQIEKQKAAASKVQDMGAGGGVPSAPAKQAKTLKEATKHMLDDIESGRVR